MPSLEREGGWFLHLTVIGVAVLALFLGIALYNGYVGSKTSLSDNLVIAILLIFPVLVFLRYFFLLCKVVVLFFKQHIF